MSFAIFIHASANLSGFLIRYFVDIDSSSMDKTLVENYGGLLDLEFAIVGSLLIITTCIYYLKREFKKRLT